MPKRTNALQKAIKIVETYKGNFLRLQESAILQDRETGKAREVDILIEGEINSHSIMVAIEVRDRNRPADISWVEEMISKHNSLPTDKLILVSSSGFTKAAQDKAMKFYATPIDTSKGEKNFRELLEKATYLRGVRVHALVFVDDTPINLDTKLQIGDCIATTEEQIRILCKSEKFKETMLDTGNNNEPGLIAEVHSPFLIDGKESSKDQILKFVIFIDPMPDVPINLSTIQYQGIEYVYGNVGKNPHYFVMDMGGGLIGHEND